MSMDHEMRTDHDAAAEPPMTGPPPTPVEPGIVADEPASRPLGVVVLGLLILAIGIQSLLVAFGYLEARTGSMNALLTDPVQARTYNIVFGVLCVYAAVAMWFFWRTGWYLATIVAGLSMLLQIIQYVWGAPNYVSLGLAVATAFYLNQREVKARFLRPRAEPSTVTLTVARDDVA